MSDLTAADPAAAATSPAPTVDRFVEPTTKGDLTISEAATMMKWIQQDLAAGKLTPEQANKAFDQLNASPEQRAPDQRTDEQKNLDQQFPAAQARDYTIRYGRPGEDVKETPELKAFDANARTWMSAAGFPRETGNSLVAAIAKVTDTTSRMTESQLETYGHTEFQKLQRVHGEKLEARLQDAALMIDQLEQKTPGLKTLLKSKGIGDNAMVANMLIAHATIYHARKGR